MTSRRNFLLGGLAVTAAASLGLPTLIARAAPSKKLVLIHVSGGWDVTYCLDPKLGLDNIDGPDLDEDRGTPDDRETIESIHGIPLALNPFKRPAVRSFFETWGDRAAVINGIWIGSVTHLGGTIRIKTGTREETNPDMAAIAGFTGGIDRPIPYMDLSGGGFSGDLAPYSGRTGRNNQLSLLLDRRQRLRGPSGSGLTYPQYLPDAQDTDAVQAFLAARATSLADRSATHERTQARVADWMESYKRAQLLREDQTGFADSLSLGRQSSLQNMAPTVRQLLQSGLCQSVHIDSGPSWDTHDDISDQHALYQGLFTSLDVLMRELSDAGLLQDTVVAVVSEMTRTPLRNGNGGKDHWPMSSVLLLGGGVASGVYGGTNDVLDAQPVDLASGVVDQSGVLPQYSNVVAGILELVGAKPSDWFYGVEAYRAFQA